MNSHSPATFTPTRNSKQPEFTVALSLLTTTSWLLTTTSQLPTTQQGEVTTTFPFLTTAFVEVTTRQVEVTTADAIVESLSPLGSDLQTDYQIIEITEGIINSAIALAETQGLGM